MSSSKWAATSSRWRSRMSRSTAITPDRTLSLCSQQGGGLLPQSGGRAQQEKEKRKLAYGTGWPAGEKSNRSSALWPSIEGVSAQAERSSIRRSSRTDSPPSGTQSRWVIACSFTISWSSARFRTSRCARLSVYTPPSDPSAAAMSERHRSESITIIPSSQPGHVPRGSCHQPMERTQTKQ
jgi:hypothetical protein